MANPATYVNQNSGEQERYTNPQIMDGVHRVLGEIDLDPASCAKANTIVRATQFYTKEMDGLSLPWGSRRNPVRLWMNHPFGKPEYPCKKNCTKKICVERGHHNLVYKPGNPDWIDKILNEYDLGHISEACMICFGATSETWFQRLLYYPVCFLSPRVNYLDENLHILKGITKGSVITYLGDDVDRFEHVFRRYGRVKR